MKVNFYIVAKQDLWRAGPGHNIMAMKLAKSKDEMALAYFSDKYSEKLHGDT